MAKRKERSKKVTLSGVSDFSMDAADQASAEMISEPSLKVITLSSGKKVKFRLLHIPANRVSSKTYVIQDINGRDQSALTEESVADITRTIGLQQFYPAIGVLRADGTELLDGSRRRAAAIIEQVGLDVLETDEEISITEARQLAKDIQTAKEHNLREIGLSLAPLKASGMSQKEIAVESALSESKVTRALQAASVPADMLSRFPDQNELTYPDYKSLMEINNELASKNLALNDLLEELDLAKTSLSDDLASDDYKQALMKAYNALSKKLIAKPAKAKAQVTKLKAFDDKNSYARKKVQGRNFKYEFQRLPAELQNDIDLAISEVINKFYQD